MRHGKKFNHLGRKTAHRSAMLSNMASSLIMHKRINTTVAKAKALRKYIEPILTKSKTDDTHSRRVAFSYLQDKESVTELFSTVAEKIASRPGGYTRIIKTGARLGDNAEMCMMELVDFNELMLSESGEAKAKTRRSRRGGKSKAKTEAPKADVAEVKEEATAEVVEEVKEEKKAEEVEVKAEETEAKAEETEKKEESKEEKKKED
ncbi:LSU ribosomal protein L17P [Ekhidna lutea]|uniref:Large ribosomal subunit protein bL17 n=1 Tax=Ekhidna lutea TaxID=447679 RepID=A0A239JD79_EKHLU|nr:50S ribosomal protein L17 [Ekhidna lutea]SNT03861.1 LSU ribosomal protein L17P [Ekhidna lutea]